MIKLYRHIFKDERGAVTVEMAFLAALFFLMLAGLYDFGRLIVTQQKLEHAVRGGIQYGLQSQAQAQDYAGVIAAARAAVAPDDATMTITAYAQCECPGGVSVSCSDDCLDGTFPPMELEVRATDTYRFYFATFLGVEGGIPLEAEAEVRAR